MKTDLANLKAAGEAPEWLTDEGFKTLCGGYLLSDETPRGMYLRVARAAASYYDKLGTQAFWEARFFDVMWKNWLCPASPVLSNLGTTRGLPISCNSIHVKDSVDNIFAKAHELAMLSKHGAGVGIYLGDVRGRGESIHGNGRSEGIIPWAKVYDSTIVSIAQGATRRGAGAIYLPVEHPDAPEFINMRRPTGDVNRRCLNINHGLTIQDEWMRSMLAGDAAKREVWQEILKTRVETGEPYLFFADNVNGANPDCYKANNLRVSTSNICCLAGDTKVLTKEFGPRNIRDLVGERVTIFDGQEWVQNESFEYKGQDELYAITLADGSVVEANGNHRWFVANDYAAVAASRYREIFTRDLTKGIFLEFHEQEQHGAQTEPGAYLKGFLLGDGTATHTENRAIPVLNLHFPKFACMAELIASCAEIPTQAGLRSDAILAPQFGEVCTSPDAWGAQVYRRMKGLSARRDALISWAADYKCELPTSVWSAWTRDSKLRFLSGLFDADACWATCNIQWATKSERLVAEIKLMLSTLGIRCSKSQVNNVFRLNIYAAGALKIVEAGYLRRLGGPKRLANRNQTGWRRVISVERLGRTAAVYCPTVPSTGKFALANGLMTGNSEITLHTDADHSFVCCLSSLNLARWNEWKDSDLPETATYFLDAVLSEYIERGQGVVGLDNSIRSAVKGRAIGIGVLGWHSLLQSSGYPFDSLDAMMLNARVFKMIRAGAEKATKELSWHLGEPEWCRGFERRNTHLLAVAPTVSNSLIAGGQSAGVEPLAANVYAQKSAKGTFIRRNPALERVLTAAGMNDEGTWRTIIENDGSVQHLSALPETVRAVFATAREINQHAIVRQAIQRQKWVDQAQSINLFFAGNSDPKYIHEVHVAAWQGGLKTLYYLRSSGVIKGDLASRASTECAACEA